MQLNFADFTKALALSIIGLIPVGYFLKIGSLGDVVDITLLLYVLAFAFTVLRLVICKTNIYFFKEDIVIILWTLIMIISLFYTPFVESGIVKTLKLISLEFSLIYLTRILIENRRDLLIIVKTFFIGSIIIEIQVIIEFLKQGAPLGRFYYFDIHPVPLTMLGVVGLGIIILLIIFKKIKFYLFLPLFLLNFITVILSSSKGPIISLIFSIVLFLPLIIRKLKLFKLFFIGGIVWFLIYIISMTQFNASLILILNRFLNIGIDESTSDRLYLYNESWTYFSKNPILGIGVSGLGPNLYPHNILLELLSENGLLIFSLFILLVLMLAKKYFDNVLKKSTRVETNIALFISLLSLFSLFFSWTYIDHKFLFLSLGILMVLDKKKELEI